MSICDVGINDLPYGWRNVNNWNYRVYRLWCSMIHRCYNEKKHERCQTYIGCTVCERWLTLSNFVEDVVKIPNYEYWLNNPNQRVALDKDIKSNGINKCYCLEQCMFVSMSENNRQSNKTMDYDFMKGENNPNLGQLINRFDKQGNLIDTKYRFEYIQMGFSSSAISNCCTGKRKSTGGYVFKYHEEDK